MGDMADFINNDYGEFYESDNHKDAVIYRYCGGGGFHWEKLARGWRLYTSSGELHECRKYALSMAKQR